MNNRQRGYTILELLFSVWGIVMLLGVVGWVWNIVKLVGLAGAEPFAVTAMFVLRVAGIPIAPLGAIVGFF